VWVRAIGKISVMQPHQGGGEEKGKKEAKDIESNGMDEREKDGPRTVLSRGTAAERCRP